MRILCWVTITFGMVSAAAGDSWRMRSHNVRRTGQTSVVATTSKGKVWSYSAVGGNAINIEPSATRKHVVFGTWGLMRRIGFDKRKWDKFDGKVYSLNPATGKPVWKPLHPGLTPYAYDYAGRKPTQQDRPAGPGRHWNWSNGTVEGTAAIDAKETVAYIGRGDGYLYCIDLKSGRVKWRFKTFDPARKNDPEGGGEVVGGPLLTPRGTIVFATFAAPHRPKPPRMIRHETNAVYAVNARGKLMWRYPKIGTLSNVFQAPPALSKNGKRVYVVTGLPGKGWPCEMLALDLAGGRLAWRMNLGLVGGHDVAVGVDGRIYVAGMDEQFLGMRPSVFAIDDLGTRGKFAWGPFPIDGKRPKTHFAGGIALNEKNGRVVDVYVTTAIHRPTNGRGGRLHRLEPTTGKVTATWNPEQATPSCAGGLTDVSIDAKGNLFVGCRGRKKTLVEAETRGRMYALSRTGKTFRVLWSHEVDGQLDWASPAIGPGGGVFFGSSDRIGEFLHAIPRGQNEVVPQANPKFYGVLPP